MLRSPNFLLGHVGRTVNLFPQRGGTNWLTDGSTARRTPIGGDMLMPGDDVLLIRMQERCRELRAQKEVAKRLGARGRADELQAEIDELETDYESVVKAAC